jgi:hypothetical protein
MKIVQALVSPRTGAIGLFSVSEQRLQRAWIACVGLGWIGLRWITLDWCCVWGFNFFFNCDVHFQ